MHRKAYLLALITLLSSAPALFCQTSDKDPVTLQMDEPLRGHLAQKEVSPYKVSVEEGTFVYGVVE